MSKSLPKQIPLRPIPVGAKVRLGIAYGLSWFIISKPTWDNLYSLRPYHEGIPFRAALIFVILPFVVGGIASFLDYMRGHPGLLAATFSGWVACFVGGVTSLFVGPHYSVAILYILPILASSSVGSIAANLWLRKRHPITIESNASENA